MKKGISLLLVVVLVLGCVGLFACGDKESETTQEPSQTSSTPSTPSPTETTPSPAGGLTWNDMPVYSGANQIQKGSWAIPPAEGDYSKFEWRYYETKDNLDNVAAFYKGQMSVKGWGEEMWMEASQQMYWGMYTKNGEKDAAMVWGSFQDGKTVIAMWRATK